mgnify:CR=1 FL=1
MTQEGLLPDHLFRQCVAALPLVSIDLCVIDDAKRLLLGKRNNAPATGWWFTPGARIRKNEPLANALVRVLQEELSLPPSFAARARLMGAWDHFYPDSAFDPAISTHYVNLPHALFLTVDELRGLHLPMGAGEQHSDWRWHAVANAAVDVSVHPYVQTYARWLMEH